MMSMAADRGDKINKLSFPLSVILLNIASSALKSIFFPRGRICLICVLVSHCARASWGVPSLPSRMCVSVKLPVH